MCNYKIITATEVEDRICKYGEEVQASMCNLLLPIVDDLIEKCQKSGIKLQEKDQ